MTVARNTIYNVAGAVVPIAVSLFTVPAYLSAVGEDRFGILAVAWLLLGYFGIFDLGLGMASAHYIAGAPPENPRQRTEIFWSALIVNVALGVLGGLLIWPAAHYYFADVIVASPDVRAEMVAAVPWLILAVPMATTTGVLTGALQGMKDFARLNLISVIGTVFFQLLPLLAATFWSPALPVVLPVSLLARALTLLMLWAPIRESLTRGQPITLSASRARSMLKFGGWVTASVFFVPFLAFADRFSIGALLGAAAISLYVVPLNLGDRLTVLGNSLGTALFPELTERSPEQRLALAAKSELLLLALMLPVTVGAIFAVRPFLELWVGTDFASRSAPAATILMAGVFFDSVSRIPLFALRGAGQPEAVVKVDLIQILPYFAILYLGLHWGGIEGVAIAYVFRVAMNYVLLAIASKSFRATVRQAIGCSALLAAAYLGAARFAEWTSLWWIALLLGGSLSLLVGWKILPDDSRWALRRRAASAMPAWLRKAG